MAEARQPRADGGGGGGGQPADIAKEARAAAKGRPGASPGNAAAPPTGADFERGRPGAPTGEPAGGLPPEKVREEAVDPAQGQTRRGA